MLVTYNQLLALKSILCASKDNYFPIFVGILNAKEASSQTLLRHVVHNQLHHHFNTVVQNADSLQGGPQACLLTLTPPPQKKKNITKWYRNYKLKTC